jgi:hypothetical protein
MALTPNLSGYKKGNLVKYTHGWEQNYFQGARVIHIMYSPEKIPSKQFYVSARISGWQIIGGSLLDKGISREELPKAINQAKNNKPING